jgi:hypothetical protein
MFAGLSVNAGKPLSFDGIHDFSINNIPCEVKTIHDQMIITKDDDGKTVIGSKKRGIWRTIIKG